MSTSTNMEGRGRRKAAFTTLALLAAAAVISACGGTGEQQSAAADGAQAGLEFAECMRDNGIEVPDPDSSEGGGFSFQIGGTGGVNPEDPAFQEAEKACGHILADAIPDDVARATEVPQAALDYAECMREQGLDYPDPIVEGGMAKIGPADGAEVSDERLRAADEACRDLATDESLAPPQGD